MIVTDGVISKLVHFAARGDSVGARRYLAYSMKAGHDLGLVYAHIVEPLTDRARTHLDEALPFLRDAKFDPTPSVDDRAAPRMSAVPSLAVSTKLAMFVACDDPTGAESYMRAVFGKSREEPLKGFRGQCSAAYVEALPEMAPWLDGGPIERDRNTLGTITAAGFEGMARSECHEPDVVELIKSGDVVAFSVETEGRNKAMVRAKSNDPVSNPFLDMVSSDARDYSKPYISPNKPKGR